MKVTAICPGSYDPPTNGHVDILSRCVLMYERVVAAVVVNPSKTALFSLDERMDFLRELVPGIEVRSFSGLLVDAATEWSAQVIVKGLRGAADFEYEQQMAHMNRHLTGVDTVFVPSSPELMFVSSSLVKEVSALGGDVSSLVPGIIHDAMKERHVG
jgi:pantetheine-phosphate adenylyltransferase